MDYIIYIACDFGEFKVQFETDGILKDDKEVFQIAMEKLGESLYVNIEALKLLPLLTYEVTTGYTMKHTERESGYMH